ncbi:MAG TPA: EamA family transporter [Candidatus Thermoplasmatota archaeon]|nr:EamA family transporter [Candidatus Thermoplasmatota archaeon]
MRPSKTWLGVAMALGSALLFGFVNAVAKDGSVEPLALTGLTYLIAGLVALPFAASFRPARRGGSSLAGVLLVLLAALGWAADNVLGARLMGRHKAHHLLVVKGLVGGALALGLAAALGQSVRAPAGSWPGVLFIGVLGIGASAFAFYVALGAIGAARASAILWPGVALTGVVAGAVLLHEPLTLVHAIAAALVVAGVLLVASGGPSADAATPSPAA